jgi:hypothetical protein
VCGGSVAAGTVELPRYLGIYLTLVTRHLFTPVAKSLSGKGHVISAASTVPQQIGRNRRIDLDTSCLQRPYATVATMHVPRVLTSRSPGRSHSPSPSHPCLPGCPSEASVKQRRAAPTRPSLPARPTSGPIREARSSRVPSRVSGSKTISSFCTPRSPRFGSVGSLESSRRIIQGVLRRPPPAARPRPRGPLNSKVPVAELAWGILDHRRNARSQRTEANALHRAAPIVALSQPCRPRCSMAGPGGEASSPDPFQLFFIFIPSTREPTLSCPVLSYPVLSYPILSYVASTAPPFPVPFCSVEGEPDPELIQVGSSSACSSVISR